MGDIRINGSSGVISTQSVAETPLHTASIDATTPEDQIPLVGTETSETSAAEGDVPDPSGSPMARAAWLQDQLAKQEEYAYFAEQLQSIVESGGPDAAQAQKLLAKLRQVQWSERRIEKAQEEWDEMADLAPDGDLDGDGVANEVDPDIDDDGITNRAEEANGTSIVDRDSDRDGITDYGELWLKQHNYTYGWMDANNADANNNGIVDGKELPDSLRMDKNGNGTTGGTPPKADGYQWNPPSAQAQTVNAADGNRTVSADYDVVFHANGGNLDFRKEGRDLLIKTADGTVRVTGYYGEDNKPRGKVFIEGTATGITTSNADDALAALDLNGDGYADAGIHLASGIDVANIVNNYDPFNGSVPISSNTNGTTVYNVDGAAGNFQIPSAINGTPVKAVEIKVDGQGVLVILKGSIDGDPLKTFRLKAMGKGGAKALLESGAIHFTLADTGQYFYSADVKATVDGGKGDDEIFLGKGGTANGKDGNDMLRGGDGDVVFNGGRGDDFVLGGSGRDTLIGGEGDGMDYLYSGSSIGDTLKGGDGDDILIVDGTKTTDVYDLQGNGGNDMTNSANPDLSNSAHGIEVGVANPSQILTYLQEHRAEANADLAEELENVADHIGEAATMASEMIKQAALKLMTQKKAEWDAKYGKDSQDPPENGDIPPPDSEDQ